jgi:hypothetical protein
VWKRPAFQPQRLKDSAYVMVKIFVFADEINNNLSIFVADIIDLVIDTTSLAIDIIDDIRTIEQKFVKVR